MKNKIALVAFLIWQVGFSQTQLRTVVHGQVLNDSIKVENVIIFNVNANKGALANSQGFFTIKARENDTLVFSSLLFKSKKIIISAADIKASALKVKLRTFTNQLAEVVIENTKKEKEFGNTQAIVDKKYMDDAQSSPKNTVMAPVNVIENGVDFVRMYKDVLKILRKNNPKKNDFTSSNSFTEVVMNRMNYPFFHKTLEVPDDQIKLFLVFCENDSKSKSLLKSASDFEIMDYLIEKNKEFKTIGTLEK